VQIIGTIFPHGFNRRFADSRRRVKIGFQLFFGQQEYEIPFGLFYHSDLRGFEIVVVEKTGFHSVGIDRHIFTVRRAMAPGHTLLAGVQPLP